MADPGTIQVPDPSGTKCCDCAAQVGCSCGALCSFKCRSIAGSAIFCGYPEYVPSVPPLYYRTKTLSGGWTFAIQGFEGCGPGSNPLCDSQLTYAGSGRYDKTTCVLTSTMTRTTDGGCFGDASSCQSAAVVPVSDISPVDCNECGVIGLNNPPIELTTGVTIPGDGCGQSSSGVIGGVASGEAISVLSDLDTIADAVLRETGPDPAWQSPSQGDCFASTSYTTAWDSPTFAFSKAQVQVTIPGTVHGHTYQVTIKLSERATGSVAPYAPFGLLEVTVSGVDGTTLTPWVDIPMEEGLQIAATACSVADIT